MPAELEGRARAGAIIRMHGRSYEVLRFEVRGTMLPGRVILEDLETGKVTAEIYDDVKRDATLVRAADAKPKVPEVPASTECLIAEARALRLAP
jgi:hypothetical protein